MTDPVALLAAAVGPEGAAQLRPHLEELALNDGEILFTDGVPSSHLCVLLEGELAVVYRGPTGTIELGVRPPGSWLGEVGFIDAGPATATVIAKGPCRLWRIDHPTVVRLIDEEPAVASVLLRHVMRQLAERIALSSSGIVEQVAPGQVRVRKPHEVRGWVSQALGWLLGHEASR